MGPAPVPPGAVGYWSFDDGTGSDGSGSGNDATIFGAVPTAGYVGDGLDFNGAGNHLQIADSATLDFAVQPDDAGLLDVCRQPVEQLGDADAPDPGECELV